MSDFTAHWHWPQWTIVILLFIRFTLIAARHGDEILETEGARKGQPKRYNGFSAASQIVLWCAILICGGFFA